MRPRLGARRLATSGSRFRRVKSPDLRSETLRRAMTAACKPNGKPTFSVLSAVDENGKPVPVPRGSVPSFHGLRHTAASEAIRDGESAEEVSWLLGHRNSVVTRSSYIHEIGSAERSARRRAKF